MDRATSQENGQVRELSHEKSWEMFDRQTRRYLDISGEEFARAYDAGEFGDPDDREENSPAVMRLAMLLPFVR